MELFHLLLHAGSSRRFHKIHSAILATPGVDQVIHLRTVHLGPDDLLVAAKIGVPADAEGEDIAATINAAEARIREVLLPGGVFVLSTFDQPDARWKVVEGAVRPFWPATDEPSLASAKQHFSSTASVEALLAEAGFVDAGTVVLEHVNVYRDVQQWLEWTWSAGARVVWERVPSEQLDAAQAAACEVVAALAEDDGTLRERFTVRLTRAVAP